VNVSVRLSDTPLSSTAAMRALEGPGLGGVVLFAGRVRPDRVEGGRVEALDYEAHLVPARQQLAALERTARLRFGAERVVLWHRVGRVKVGEVSVLVGAACGHRAAAFEATRFLIEELKTSVPIWKTARARSGRRPPRRPDRRAAR
jgi:molybdopterin synthase catalytic subunit